MAAETENQIVVYRPNETIRLDIRLENETLWLTQERMCELFQRERSVITKHIRKVFSEGECDEKNNVQILHVNQRGRPVPRPLPRYRRQGALSCRRVAQRPRQKMFRVYRTGQIQHSGHYREDLILQPD